MLVGYARTSTAEQEAGLAAQERDLRRAGCERLFSEQVSSVAQRPQLAAALDYVRDGDKLIVTRLDRLARGMGDLLEIAEPAFKACRGPVNSLIWLDFDWELRGKRFK